MSKTILITGATDGIGLEAAKLFAAEGHKLLLHGRSPAKLDVAAAEVGGETKLLIADLSDVSAVKAMADEVIDAGAPDVIINNAGVLKAPQTRLQNGLDIRLMVNTLAPYLLAHRIAPLMSPTGRIINLSSAAQAPVDIDALEGRVELSDMEAYSQSKLAITIWSQEMAKELTEGPVVIALNPGSLLASKMVKDGFGIAGNDIGIGARIIFETALNPEFSSASGKYYDNDAGRFGPPHKAASDPAHCAAVMESLKGWLASVN